MTFKKAMHDTCRELGLDSHLKEIRYKKDAHTYAEKIATTYQKMPFMVKNSFMFLDGVDFCFFQNGNDVEFSISGIISRNDKYDILGAITKALKVCEVCEKKMREDAE